MKVVQITDEESGQLSLLLLIFFIVSKDNSIVSKNKVAVKVGNCTGFAVEK